MKVLLIKPSHEEIFGRIKGIQPEYPPLGLGYVAAVLEQDNHEVKILDMPAENTTEDELKKLLSTFSPDVIGINATTPTIAYAKKIAEICKQTTDVVILMGGPHPTSAPEDCLSDKNVDIVIRGEGELTIKELVQNLDNLKDVKGISYRNNGEIIHNSQMELIKDIDSLPFPARHLFNIRVYKHLDAIRNPITTILTSRGCPYACTFCSSRHIFGRIFRPRQTKSVVDEIQMLVEEYGIREIHILDDAFTLDQDRAISICDEIIKRGLNKEMVWCTPNGIRVNCVSKKLLEKMKEAGCYKVSFGVESGNQKILDVVKKGITLEQVRNAFKLAKEVGLETWAFFIFGLPGETKETIRNTIEFAKEIDPDVAKFHLLLPLPHTEIFDLYNKEGWITDYDFTHYEMHTKPVISLPNLPENELLKLYKQAYREFYLRPYYLFKQFRKSITNPIRLFNKAKMAVKILS